MQGSSSSPLLSKAMQALHTHKAHKKMEEEIKLEAWIVTIFSETSPWQVSQNVWDLLPRTAPKNATLIWILPNWAQKDHPLTKLQSKGRT